MKELFQYKKLNTSEILLKLEKISVSFDGVKALDKVSFWIDEGEIVALMGPNGAGKSTLLKAIFGLVKISEGKIFWQEKPFFPVSHKVIWRGISFVPQGRRVFSNLTIEENLEVGGFIMKEKEELNRRIEEVLEIFPVLKRKRKAKAGKLSGGEQQMLALARGLMSAPTLLLLDEPSLGLAPKIIKEVFQKIKEVNQRHKTAILVVEHNIKSLLEIVHRAYVLDKGKIVIEGSPQKILQKDILEKVFTGRV